MWRSLVLIRTIIYKYGKIAFFYYNKIFLTTISFFFYEFTRILVFLLFYHYSGFQKLNVPLHQLLGKPETVPDIDLSENPSEQRNSFLSLVQFEYSYETSSLTVKGIFF